MGTGTAGQVSFYYRGELLAGGARGEGRRKEDEGHRILCGEDCLPYSTSFNYVLK